MSQTIEAVTPQERVEQDADTLLRAGVSPCAGWPAGVPRPRPRRKVCASLEEAIKRSGLADGGTISFHHHFGEADQVLLPVVAELDRLGFRGLTLAASNLGACQAGLSEFIRHGVISRIYTSGVTGRLGEAISRGLMDEPVMLHTDGGRCALADAGELRIDVAFLGVPGADMLGNASGTAGTSRCGSLGYAMADARRASCVVVVTEQLCEFPLASASIRQDQVDLVVQVDRVAKAGVALPASTPAAEDPEQVRAAHAAAELLVHSGLFRTGFSLQVGPDALSVATMQFLCEAMAANGVRAGWALGGITGAMVEAQRVGLIDTLLDAHSLDDAAAGDLAGNPAHREIGVDEYANPFSKGAAVDELDLAVLPARQVGLDFGVNTLTDVHGVLSGTCGAHGDVAAGAKLAIVVAPLLRGGVPTVVEQVTTLVTPGSCIAALVTDRGVAVNPDRPELGGPLVAAGLPVRSIAELAELAGREARKQREPDFTDRVVAVVRQRSGWPIDTIHQA